MATSVLAVLSLAAVATFGTAMGHGSTTNLEITASDKDTGSWMAKMGDTKVAVEHKHLEGNAGSGEWTLKLSQSSDLDGISDISEDKNLQQRDAPMDDLDQSMGTQMMPQQDSYAFAPGAEVSGPNAWEFQQRIPETLTPPGVYQDPSYFPSRIESLSAPDTMLRPPPALPPFSYNMASRQTQPLLYPVAPNRIQRGLMAPPLQPNNALRYEPEIRYNVPSYDPNFGGNRLDRTFVTDVVQPNMAPQSYLPLWQTPESMTVPQQQYAVQQDSYLPQAFAGQQNYFPQNEQSRPEPLNNYQYTAVVIPQAEEQPPAVQNIGTTEYSREVPSGMFSNPDPGMLQAIQHPLPFLYAPNSAPDSTNVAPQEEAQTPAETNIQDILVPPQPPSINPEHSAGYASDPDREQKYVIVEALVVSNPETAPAQQLSRGDVADQPLPYRPSFFPRPYSEEIEGLKAPQPLPLLVNERIQDAPKLISDYSAPSYGMTPPSRVDQRDPDENEVVPEYKDIQDYHPYGADIAFRPIQRDSEAVFYMPTSVINQKETPKTESTTPDVDTSSEKQK